MHGVRLKTGDRMKKNVISMARKKDEILEKEAQKFCASFFKAIESDDWNNGEGSFNFKSSSLGLVKLLKSAMLFLHIDDDSAIRKLESQIKNSSSRL